ncbi:MAG TPA: hypothetical protein VNI77_03935 [Nitrososphaera sp.]|nr:hypothetical protein [Nitrososphaera sp.]
MKEEHLTNPTGQQQYQNEASISSALDRPHDQLRTHHQQQAAMNITDEAKAKQKATEAANAIDGTLTYYANAFGGPNVGGLMSQIKMPLS